MFMHDFILRELHTKDLLKELNLLGFDRTYAPVACKKFGYKNLKIYALTIPQVNILKQTALSVGADCATPRKAITGEAGEYDCVLGGSLAQLSNIAEKLSAQPFGLKDLAKKLEFVLQEKDHSRTRIMGILNITPNSFSDGGQYENFPDTIFHLNKMIEEGADIVDIGAESTKPFSEPVGADIQIKKILPVLEYVRENNIKIPISIDTRSAEVARVCLESGAAMINDVSGMSYDRKMAKVVAEFNCPVIIQHAKGTPETMQLNPEYKSLMDEIFLDLNSIIEIAVANGVKKEKIIVDPGIGFGKTREHNFEIIRRIEEFKSFDCPVLLGLSRKSLLNIPDEPNEVKDIYTLALNTLAIENKVDIIRVHNVKLHKQLLEMLA